MQGLLLLTTQGLTLTPSPPPRPTLPSRPKAGGRVVGKASLQMQPAAGRPPTPPAPGGHGPALSSFM